jgi:hypothetical protein
VDPQERPADELSGVPGADPGTTAHASSPDAHASRIRLRALALIFVTQILLISWVSDSEIARGVYLICYSLMMPTVLYLVVVSALRRWLPLSRAELLLGYIVLTATIPIIGFGGIRFLLPGLGYLPYYAGAEPGWSRYLGPWARLPVLHDAGAVQGLFRGGPVPWTAWAAPIAFWSLYLLLLSGIWLGLGALLHRIWVRQERLVFPIAALPLEVMEPKVSLVRRPLFWMGFVPPMVLQSLLVLHDWYPAVPCVTLKAIDVKDMLFTSPPWDSIPNISIGFYPMAIGLAYLVPSNVSLSCWVFYLLTRLSYVVATMMGVEAAGSGEARFPYPEEQAAGAWIAIGLLALWGLRRHGADMLRSLSSSDRRRTVRLGACAVVCALLCALMMGAVGVPPLAAVATIAIYVLYVLSGARVRAEAGSMWAFAPVVWTPFRTTAGLSRLPAQPGLGLVSGGVFDLVHVDIRAQSLPFLMEGLKIAETAGIRWRSVILWVAVGTVTALGLGWWSGLHNFYAVGAATGKADHYAPLKAHIAFETIHNMTTMRPGWDSAGALAILVGIGITLLLSTLRLRLSAFPFVPLGYALCNTLTMTSMVVPIFLAWLVKTLVQRYGGIRAYRTSVHFFIGVILGDILTQTFWTLIGRIFNVSIYQFLT